MPFLEWNQFVPRKIITDSIVGMSVEITATAFPPPSPQVTENGLIDKKYSRVSRVTERGKTPAGLGSNDSNSRKL